MKFCKDCKHLSRYSNCGHPSNIRHDPVTGDPEYRNRASIMRIIEVCGKDAKLFEPKGPAPARNFYDWLFGFAGRV